LKQQPLAQVAGLQGFRAHSPDASQCSSALHTVQGKPPAPHALSLGFWMHWLPLQQPLQFAGPQPSWVQAPFWQRSLLSQATQAEPLIPQVLGEVAEMSSGMQVPLGAQQPRQLAELQAPTSPSPHPAAGNTRHRQGVRTSNALLIAVYPQAIRIQAPLHKSTLY
jgi:hypothetical protein